jgi:iron uptake system EfeUOB component EfeO/EfeM
MSTTAAVDAAMRAVHISAEPASGHSAPSAGHYIKRENDVFELDVTEGDGGNWERKKNALRRDNQIKGLRTQREALLDEKRDLQGRIKSLERAAE